MKDNKQIWTIIGITVIVALVVSLGVAGITGNVIKVRQSLVGTQVYTKAEVDSKTSNLCKFVWYKDFNKEVTVLDSCKQYGYTPKMIVSYYNKELFNHVDCSSSYQIFESGQDSLLPYYNNYANRILGEITNLNCNNVTFPDGSLNGNFSIESNEMLKGVLCCK
ncbi:MAG: hypothetical protein WC533_04455 [Candidatus Pacearchaeota archaeon]